MLSMNNIDGLLLQSMTISNINIVLQMTLSKEFFCVIIFFLKKVLVNKFFALSLHTQSRDIDCLG